MKRLPAIVALSVSIACSSSNGPNTAPPTSPDAGADAGPIIEPVAWAACDLYTEGGGPPAECATIKTPLDAKNPKGEAIDMFVKRFKPKGGKSLRALWLLQGGPGASGHVFEKLSEQIATKFPDVDYYMPDHRGTGGSTRLGCPVQEAASSEGGISITDAEWPACVSDIKARESARLPYFNTTNAANDLGVMIERTKTPDQPVFVYGVSYGTYLAHRYLQLYPSQAAGVAFDSTAPQGASLARQDEDANEAMKDFMAACAQDAVCGQKLGTDPWAKAVALQAKLKSGHCAAVALPDFPLHALFRRTFGQLLMDFSLRGYIPSMIYRLDRCNADDVVALKQLVFQLTQEQPPSQEMIRWGWIVSQNITLSELWESPSPTKEELAQTRETLIASRDVTTLFEPVVGIWPTYTPDAYAKSWATSDSPVLFLQGGLDPATLLRKARAAKPHFTKPNQHWVEIPTASHTVIVSSATSEKRSCGTMILMSFIENPKGELDTSCLAKVLPVNFAGTEAFTRALYGKPDMWEN